MSKIYAFCLTGLGIEVNLSKMSKIYAFSLTGLGYSEFVQNVQNLRFFSDRCRYRSEFVQNVQNLRFFSDRSRYRNEFVQNLRFFSRQVQVQRYFSVIEFFPNPFKTARSTRPLRGLVDARAAGLRPAALAPRFGINGLPITYFCSCMYHTMCMCSLICLEQVSFEVFVAAVCS